METINHEYYVSPEVAKLLRQAGFDWPVKQWYEVLENGQAMYAEGMTYNMNCGLYGESVYSMPTLDVAQRWLREVKGIHICTKADAASINCKYFVAVIISDTKWGNVQDENKKTILFNTYEEAQETGIKKALEIMLEKEDK